MFILQVQFSEIDDILSRIEGKGPAHPHQPKEEERRTSSSTDGQDTFEAQEARRNTGKLLPKVVQIGSGTIFSIKASEGTIRLAGALEAVSRTRNGQQISQSLSLLLGNDGITIANRLANSPTLSAIARSRPMSMLQSCGNFFNSLIRSGRALEGAGTLAKAGRFLGGVGRFLTTGVGGRVLPVLGAAIAVIDCGKDIHNLCTMKQAEAEGETQKEYETRLGKARWDTSVNVGCTATGAVIGGIIGSIIPGAGTALGVMVGAGIGNLVGNLFKSEGWGTKAVSWLGSALF